jgi:CheY-like chemotaxis protein
MANLEFSLRDVAELSKQIGSSRTLQDLQEQLSDAREASERVRQIVRDLRILSRGEDEERGPVDVRRVMESTLRMAWNEIRHRARLVKDYQVVPLVEASEARLGQVFLNIVMNAAQAMTEGPVDKNLLRITTGTRGSRVVVEIGDTGPGIAPDVMKRLFTPFVTTKPVGTGTGLGLSICERIVSELGGEIEVDTKPGDTVFRIVLPPALSEAEAPKPAALEAATAVRRGKVLTVDDEPMILKAVRRTLAGEHDVVTVSRAQEALDLVRGGERYDVILCDLMMPELSGIDFFTELLGFAPDQAKAVIFITGGAFTPRSREFLDGVPNQRVEKPFGPVHLRALVNDRFR